MTKFIRAFLLTAAPFLLFFTANGADFPGWAYPVNPPGSAPAPDDGRGKHVPDSAEGFTRPQLANIGGTVCDWHPEEHPAMPVIVARSREAKVYACGYCHLPTGAGRPENASIAGLSPAYFKAQMLAFKNGDRPGSEPARAPQTTMIALAQQVTDAEVEEAAAYFAAVKPVSYLEVIETESVPRTVVAGWTLAPAPGGGSEPLGRRIIEMPVDFARFENRDSRTPYRVYVPVGSVQRGEVLVTTGDNGRIPLCVTCHGPELRGLLDVPRLVGRSPSYLMRQLHDIKAGQRRGVAVELMKPIVAALSDEDMLAVVAYLASRAP